MTDNITLPRAVVEQVREALKELDYASEPYVNEIARTALTALDAALAEPEQKRDALRRDAERYLWLLNWLVKTGLLRCERCRIDSPASYGDWWILRKPAVIDGSSLIGYGKTEDAAVDAAMQEDKT
jgi:hypothetical protein